MGPDERAIRQIHSTWIDVVNASDLLFLLSLMADDVVFLNPGKAPFGRDGFSPPLLGSPPTGADPLHQRVGRRRGCRRGRLHALPGLVIGDAAYRRNARQHAGHRITVYRKQPDGRWLLARDAHTLSTVAKLGS